jgi:hypothetical protein
MRASLRDNAPAFLLVLASAILTVAFSLPIGAERLARTQYQRLEGFVGSFEPANTQDAPEIHAGRSQCALKPRRVADERQEFSREGRFHC